MKTLNFCFAKGKELDLCVIFLRKILGGVPRHALPPPPTPEATIFVFLDLTISLELLDQK